MGLLHPLARTCIRLLGPCYKTGQDRHRPLTPFMWAGPCPTVCHGEQLCQEQGSPPLPTGREGAVSTKSMAPGSGEVWARGAVKLTAGAMSHLCLGPSQADLQSVAGHHHGGNAPGEGKPEPGRGDEGILYLERCLNSFELSHLRSGRSRMALSGEGEGVAPTPQRSLPEGRLSKAGRRGSWFPGRCWVPDRGRSQAGLTNQPPRHPSIPTRGVHRGCTKGPALSLLSTLSWPCTASSTEGRHLGNFLTRLHDEPKPPCHRCCSTDS